MNTPGHKGSPLAAHVTSSVGLLRARLAGFLTLAVAGLPPNAHMAQVAGPTSR